MPAASLRRIVSPALRHPPRVLAAARAVAAELIEPMAEIDVVAAKPALRQDRGDIGGALARALRGRIDHHAGEPRRQRQPPKLPALVGDAALGIDGAEFGQQRPRLGQRAGRRRIEERELCPDRPRPIAPDRAAFPTGRRTTFPGAHRLRAKRSAARPTAGSRRRARCGRRGRGADRRRRATPARFPAASGRHRARSAAPAPARCR